MAAKLPYTTDWIGLDMNRKTNNKLKILAKQMNTSRNELIRAAVEEYLLARTLSGKGTCDDALNSFLYGNKSAR